MVDKPSLLKMSEFIITNGVNGIAQTPTNAVVT